MEAWDEEVRDDWSKKDLKIWFGVNRYAFKINSREHKFRDLYCRNNIVKVPSSFAFYLHSFDIYSTILADLSISFRY